MNCPICSRELRVTAEQVGLDGNNLPVFHRIAYCDNCGTRNDLDDPNDHLSTSREAPQPEQRAVNDNECPICRQPFRFGSEQVGVDANNNPIFHRFAYCDTCRRKKDLGLLPVNDEKSDDSFNQYGKYDHIRKQKVKKKDSALSVAAAICSLFGITFWIGAILAIIDLIKGKNDGKRHLGSYFALFMAVLYIFVFSNEAKKTTNNDTTTVVSTENDGSVESTGEEDSTADVENDSAQSKGVTGIEAEKDNSDPIEDFSYAIVGDKVVLHSYKGRDSIIEVCSSYDIDGVTYQTDISNFQVSSSMVDTVIFGEGITEIDNAVFNMSDVKAVYFPKSMKIVYDNTLSYLHPEEGETIKIYYEGTQDEWSQIFTEYHRQTVEEAETAAEKGVALADKINEMIGAGYDSSLFEYFFSANPDDLKAE